MGTRVNGVDLDAGTSGPALSSATPQPIGTATAGVSDDAARADHVHALNTGLISAPDTGWTAAGGGAAAISGGVITETLTAAQSVAVLRRTMIGSPYLPAIEASARVTVTTAPVSGAYYAAIAVLNSSVPNSAGSARGIAVFVHPPNAIANVNTAGAWVQPTSAALPATLTSGALWLRIVYGAGYVSWYAGTGATRPTSWTRVHTAAAPDLTWQDVDQLALYAERAGGGSGDYVVQWSDIQWRSLLGAPA